MIRKKRKARRTREQLRIVDRDGCNQFVQSNMGLIGVALRANFPWLQSRLRQVMEDIQAVAMVSLAKAYRDYNPELGKPSTQAITYITNGIRNWLIQQKRQRHRLVCCDMQSDGVYVDWQRTPLGQAIHDEEERRQTTLDLFEGME